MGNWIGSVSNGSASPSSNTSSGWIHRPSVKKIWSAAGLNSRASKWEGSRSRIASVELLLRGSCHHYGHMFLYVLAQLETAFFSCGLDSRNNAPGTSWLLPWVSASPDRITSKKIPSGWTLKGTTGLYQKLKHNLTNKHRQMLYLLSDVSFLDYSVWLKAGILHLGDKSESSHPHLELRSTVMCIYLLSPLGIVFRCVFRAEAQP